MKKNIMVGILTLISMLIGSSPQVFAELIFRGGYLVKMLPTSGGYNEFLKTRYGASNPQLSGTALSAAFKSRASNWSIGLEMDDLSGNINYKTLNGDQQQNKMVLKNTLLFLAFYPRNSPNLEIDLGYGSGKLTREFLRISIAQHRHVQYQRTGWSSGNQYHWNKYDDSGSLQNFWKQIPF